MTSTAVITILLHRWYVIAAGLVLTAVAIASIHSAPGAYSTQADVVFLAPRSQAHPNPIGSTSEALIATAGLVSHLVNVGRTDPATASSGVSLMGEGIRQGASVRVPNSGGQWANSFERPVLDVQVVGPTPAWVTANLARQIDRINGALFAMQESDGIPRENFIITSSAPDLATIAHSRGEPARAMVASLTLGTTLAVLASLAWDRLLRLRRRSTSASTSLLHRMESS